MTSQMQPRSRARRERPSIYDVAQLAGVSHQTVSRVINGHPNVRDNTRARVIAAMKKIHYTPSAVARALATNQTRRIGVIVDSPVYYGPSSTLWGIEEAARAAGYTVAAIAVSDLPNSAVESSLEHLRLQGIDALCVVAQRFTLADLRDVDLPTLLVNAEPENGGLTASVDQYAGAIHAVEHLLDLGHARVLHVAGPLNWADGRVRARAYRDRMAEAGHPTPEIVVGDWQSDFGYELGLRPEGIGDASAIFVANDQMALGLIHGLTSRGVRVPDDVSIVGFDDIPESKHFIPPLTTVRQDFHALGIASVTALIDSLEGTGSGHASVIAPELVVRESTAPPR